MAGGKIFNIKALVRINKRFWIDNYWFGCISASIGVGGPRKRNPVGVSSEDNALQKT